MKNNKEKRTELIFNLKNKSNPDLHNMFELGQFYKRQQIHDKLGGSIQSYLPTVKKEVVCACLTKRLNPDAPNIILVGNRPFVKQSAEFLCSLKNPIPVFIKIKTNRWQYVGLYKADVFTEDAQEIAKHSLRSGRKNICRVIHLLKHNSRKKK